MRSNTTGLDQKRVYKTTVHTSGSSSPQPLTMSPSATGTSPGPGPAQAPRTSALDSGNGTGKVKRLHQIPVPETKEAARKWQLEQMAAAFRIFAKLGFSDGSSGHISLRGARSSVLV